MPRIPRDQEEFRAFIKDFSVALESEGKSDGILSEGGKKLSELLKQYETKTIEAQDFEAKRLKAVETKNSLRDEITEEATSMIAYLEYKCGKTSKELAAFKIPPRKR